MMEENDSRKVFLSVLGVAILIVAVVGITFAAYTFTTTSTGTNTITTGTITMSYAEPEAGITLTNALPLSDAAGAALSGTGNVFTFTVTANATGSVTVPYEINIQKLALDAGKTALEDTEVKILLTKGAAGAEDIVAATQKMSALLATTASSLRANTYTIHNESVVFVDGANAAGNATTTYNLRIWVADDADASTFVGTEQYKIKVHVDSRVNPIS